MFLTYPRIGNNEKMMEWWKHFFNIKLSFTVFSIFKMTKHKAEEDNNVGEIIRESISERELLRGDWLLVNYDNANKSEKWKWPKKEDKIIYKRSQTFEKLNPWEVASSRGQFIFKDIVLMIWVCIILFLYVIFNCSRSVLLIQKSIQFDCKYLMGKFCSHCVLSLDIRFIIVSHLGSIELSGLIRTVHCLHVFWSQRMLL